jgi:hypothetical protein
MACSVWRVGSQVNATQICVTLLKRATHPENLAHISHAIPEQRSSFVRYGSSMTHDQSIHNAEDKQAFNADAIGRGTFHDRLLEAAGEISYRKLGRLTDTHPETVRRYMQGQAPSATFLTNMCHVMGISGEWLLTGRGPMKCSEMRTHALSHADPSELLTAVANTLTDLCDRVDRLERFVQGIETRLNVLSPAGTSQDAKGTHGIASELMNDAKPNGSEGNQALGNQKNTAVDSGSMRAGSSKRDARESAAIKASEQTSAGRIGKAIAKRPS